MFSAFEWMVAMRYLRPRRQEGFISAIAALSAIGIFFGVGALIVVMAVMNGFRQEILTHILGVNGHLSVYGQTNELTGFDSMAETVRGVPGVTTVTPIIQGQVMVTARGVASGAVVRGIRPADLAARSVVADNIRAGSLDDFKGNVVAVGTGMADQLGLRIGEPITLISPQGTVTAFGTVPRMRAYRIAAVFKIGMSQYDSGYVFMPLEAAQVYFRLPDAVNHLEVFVDDPDRALEIGREILKAIGGVGRIYDWQQANASFISVLQVERNVMFLILTLIILVAALNIVSSMIMLVRTKGRDIAILRTMGATRGTIMRIFFLSGASIGVFGTLIGLGGSLLFIRYIEEIRQFFQVLTGVELFSPEFYFLSRMPANAEPAEVVAVVLMGLGLSFLATLYPAWRAARLDPAEALRYE